jgi:hypothetical protein
MVEEAETQDNVKVAVVPTCPYYTQERSGLAQSVCVCVFG